MSKISPRRWIAIACLCRLAGSGWTQTVPVATVSVSPAAAPGSTALTAGPAPPPTSTEALHTHTEPATYCITVTFDLNFAEMSPASRDSLQDLLRELFCERFTAALIPCDAGTLVLGLSAGSVGTALVAVHLPSGSTEAKAAAAANDIVNSPLMASPGVGSFDVEVTGTSSATADTAQKSSAAPGLDPATVAIVAAILVIGVSLVLWVRHRSRKIRHYQEQPTPRLTTPITVARGKDRPDSIINPTNNPRFSWVPQPEEPPPPQDYAVLAPKSKRDVPQLTDEDANYEAIAPPNAALCGAGTYAVLVPRSTAPDEDATPPLVQRWGTPFCPAPPPNATASGVLEGAYAQLACDDGTPRQPVAYGVVGGPATNNAELHGTLQRTPVSVLPPRQRMLASGGGQDTDAYAILGAPARQVAADLYDNLLAPRSAAAVAVPAAGRYDHDPAGGDHRHLGWKPRRPTPLASKHPLNATATDTGAVASGAEPGPWAQLMGLGSAAPVDEDRESMLKQAPTSQTAHGSADFYPPRSVKPRRATPPNAAKCASVEEMTRFRRRRSRSYDAVLPFDDDDTVLPGEDVAYARPENTYGLPDELYEHPYDIVNPRFITPNSSSSSLNPQVKLIRHECSESDIETKTEPASPDCQSVPVTCCSSPVVNGHASEPKALSTQKQLPSGDVSAAEVAAAEFAFYTELLLADEKSKRRSDERRYTDWDLSHSVARFIGGQAIPPVRSTTCPATAEQEQPDGGVAMASVASRLNETAGYAPDSVYDDSQSVHFTRRASPVDTPAGTLRSSPMSPGVSVPMRNSPAHKTTRPPSYVLPPSQCWSVPQS